MPALLKNATEAEVIVVGAGPSGCTMAAHLAACGHEVFLLESSHFPRWRVGESLTPKILPTLERTGVRRSVEEAGFTRMAGHAHLWETPQMIETDFDNGIGFQADRAIFDAILKDNAASKGAQYFEGVTVRRARGDADVVTGVEWADSEGQTGSLNASLVVDATGGAGVLARQHNLRYAMDWPTTVALVGYLKGPDHLGPRTLVEAFDGGWIWSFLLSDGRRGISLFLDPDLSTLGSGEERTDRWLQKLAPATSLTDYLQTAAVVQPPKGFDVSWYSSHTRGKKGLLVVGDAADFVDPISSQGVFRAMDGAHRASLAADHFLSDPLLFPQALRWYDDMEDRSSSVYAEQMRESYEVAAAWQTSLFFQARLDHDPRIKGVPLPSEMSQRRRHLKNLGRDGAIPDTVFEPHDTLRVTEEHVLVEGLLVSRPHATRSGSSMRVEVPELLQSVDWLSAIRRSLLVRELVPTLGLNDARSRETLMEFLVELYESKHVTLRGET